MEYSNILELQFDLDERAGAWPPKDSGSDRINGFSDPVELQKALTRLDDEANAYMKRFGRNWK